jgi:cytochrome c553
MHCWSKFLSLTGSAVLTLIAVSLSASGQTSSDKAFGQYLSSECVTCHQPTGQYQGIPSIVGWPEATFVEIMDEYRSKKRENPIMQTIAGRLSQEEVAALAAYFGSLSPPAGGSPTKESQKRRRRQ